jgi:hypothetical protein
MKYLYHLTKNNNKLHILLVDNEILGYIYLSRLSINEWEVKTVVSINNGYKMYDSAMDFLYPDFILPSRNGQIKEKVINIYKKYELRNDVLSEPINDKNDWFNKKYRLKEKLNIQFEKSDISIKYKGIKFFNSHYI